MANDFVNEEYKDRLRTSARIGKKKAKKIAPVHFSA